MANVSAFKKFTTMNYVEQGKAFLNAYWNEHQGEAEQVWIWANKFIELDIDKKGDGCDLDEFNAHRFLENVKETKTVRQMREEIRQADLDFNKRLALIEYCLWKYKHPIPDFLRRPQGDNHEELEKAERMLAEVQRAFDAVAARAEEAKQREAEAKQRERQAVEREAESKQREAEAQARREELAQAVAELKAQEDAYKAKTEDLKQKSETGGQVSRNKAKAELEIHLKEDPLPLRRAKITQEAAERKAAKAADDATNARIAAEEARKQAVAARKAAEEATAAAERAVEEAREKVRQAEAYLDEVRQQPGQPMGALWWLDRELQEKKKYLPQRRQG